MECRLLKEKAPSQCNDTDTHSAFLGSSLLYSSVCFERPDPRLSRSRVEQQNATGEAGHLRSKPHVPNSQDVWGHS
jgi:hypothetical protein